MHAALHAMSDTIPHIDFVAPILTAMLIILPVTEHNMLCIMACELEKVCKTDQSRKVQGSSLKLKLGKGYQMPPKLQGE